MSFVDCALLLTRWSSGIMALYCVRPKVSPACQCCRGGQAAARNPGQPHNSSALWRPWITTARDTEKQRQISFGSGNPPETRKPLGFQHPVRLYLPKSKAEHYLLHMGEKVLASFPVQATIHFYNDDSETEEEEEEEFMSCGLESENDSETRGMFWKQ